MIRGLVVPALKVLRRNKRFALLAIVSLGVAIALNTTMYSVLDAMIRPKLTIRAPEQLHDMRYFGDYRRRVPIRERNQEVLEHLTFHAGAAGYSISSGVAVERGSQLRAAKVVSVTPNYLSLLGVRPSAGRLLSEGDVASTPGTVILSERMWEQLFPRQPWFDSASIQLNGQPRRVVGVLPYEADYPGAYTDAWQVAPAAQIPDMPLTLVRFRDGVTVEMARAELEVLNRRMVARSGDRLRHSGFRLLPWIQPPFRTWGFHMALVGAVLAVLLIACANLANLQLARGVARTRELATRTAVGATRGAIVRQLLTESALLAFGGLVLGALLTAWGMQLVTTSVPDTLAEYVTRPQMSWRVALFAGATTLFCLLTVGLLPAIKLSRVDVNSLLKSGAGTGQSRKARRQYAYLVVVEVALALAVLCASALLTRAALTLHYEIPAQYRQLAGSFTRIQPQPGDVRTRRAWSEYLIQKATAAPEFVTAATSSFGSPRRHAVSAEDPGGAPRVVPAPTWGYEIVSPEYLRLMQLRIIKGRDFSPGEFAEPQVIVDQHTASFLWPGGDPIGKLVKLDSPHVRTAWLRVIGVAEAPLERWQIRDGDMHSSDPRPFLSNVWVLNAHDTALVLPASTPQSSGAFMDLIVRGTGEPERLPIVLGRALAGIPGVRVLRPQSFEDRLGSRTLREKHDFMAALFNIFGLCALALATLGVYAIISHGVAQRTREFGVRVAVGASAREIRALVLRDGIRLALLGIAVGLLITNQTAGTLRAFLFSDYDRYDSRVYALVALALLAVA